MQIPDLLDLIEREENEIVQREQESKCIPQWNTVLKWLREFPNDIPVFTDYVNSQILQAASSSAQRDRMCEMLDRYYTAHSTKDCGLTTYRYSRLLHIVQHFALGKEPLEST